jgi:hypothetical protein
VDERAEHFSPLNRRDFTEAGVHQWFVGLRGTGEWGQQALDALERLVEAGADRHLLVFLLMDLHQKLRWHPPSKKKVHRTLALTKELQPLVVYLAESQLREELGLDDDVLEEGPGWSLAGRLTSLLGALTDVEHRATERNKPEFDRAMGRVVEYVKEKTGCFRDAELDIIVTVLMGDTFSSRGWRKRHKNMWCAPEVSRPRQKRRIHRVTR